MDKLILKALKGSIKKWEDIVRGIGEDSGSENCPLCQVYLSQNIIKTEQGVCQKCPIFEHTKKDFCFGTPYELWCKHVGTSHSDKLIRKIYCSLCNKYAEMEIDFLKSLLLKKEKE